MKTRIFHDFYGIAGSETETVRAVCFSLEKQKGLDTSQKEEKISVISNTVSSKATQITLTNYLIVGHHFLFQQGNQQATTCPSPQCLIDQIQVQKPILVVATDQMPNHIQSRQQYHHHRQRYYRKHHQELHHYYFIVGKVRNFSINWIFF